MPSFEINPNAKKGSERDKKLQNRADAGGVEGRTAAKMLQKKGKGPSLPGRTQDMKKVSEEEVVPGIKLVDIILGEEKCGKGMYYCYTDKKCKKMPEGLKMTARFGGGGHEPQEVGIDKPVEGGEGGNGGNGGTNEAIAIEDAFGNKFMEVVDLIKPEDIVEKCWKGYKKKGMKTMFGKRYPNCVKANEENKLTDDALEKAAAATLKRHKEQGYKVHSTDSMKDVQDRIKKRSQKEEVQVDEGSLKDRARRAVQNQRDGYHGDDDALTKEMDKTKKSVAKLKNSNVVTRYSADAAAKKLEKSIKKEEVNVDEGVRLPAEYGNLLAVVVIWRGKSLMIKMFFPQAKMPTRAEIQTEIEKVYPGGKVTSFTRTDLPSSYAPTNSPLLKVQKEEAECAGTPKGEDCAVHGQKCCPNLSEEEVDEAAGEKDACYHKVKARYSVWPSAYASGALVKCRKKGAKNWGNKTKKEEVLADIAAEYLFNEGINEDGVDIFIEELGLDQFVSFVEGLSADTYLTEARAAKKARKGAKSYDQVKAEIDAKEAAKKKPSAEKTKAAAETAKKQQPKKKSALDGVARAVLKGMDRHKKAMARAKSDIETTKKIASKVGKGAREFGKGFSSGVKTAGKAAKAGYKMATEEEDRLGKSDLDEATPRPKATQRGKISKAEAQKRQARADRRAAAQERRDDRAKAGIDALIGSDEDRKAAAAARANPQGQRQKALKRTIADRMAKGAKDNKLGEKLNLKKADMGEVIDDFYDSDAPQFKGKSKEKRRQMAIAAKLQADEERACWKTHKKVGMKMKGGKLVNDCRPKNEEVEVDENRFASHGGKDSDAGSAYAKPSKGGNKKGVYTLKGKDGKPLFDKNEAIDLKKKSSERKLNTNPGEKPESAKEYRKNSEPLRKHREKFGDLAKEDWQSVNRKDKTDGLSQKAVNAYRRENPGSKLKTAVTKKPSELKKGSKDAKRRSSFCSRMKGMKKRLTSAKTARDPDSRINKALRRWNCN